MQTRIITFFSALLLTVISVLAANDTTVVNINSKTEKFTQIKTNENFAGRIYLTQGNSHCITIRGEKKEVEKMKAEVKDGVLMLHRSKDKKEKENKTDMSHTVEIHITMEDIRKISTKGICHVKAENKLELDELELHMEGIEYSKFEDIRCNAMSVTIQGVCDFSGKVQCSKMYINIEGVSNSTLYVQCDELNASVKGVGNLTLKGKTKKANIHKDGIGHIYQKDLKIK